MCFSAMDAKQSNGRPSESPDSPPRLFVPKRWNARSTARPSLKKSSKMLRAMPLREWSRFPIFTPRENKAARCPACSRGGRLRAPSKKRAAAYRGAAREASRHRYFLGTSLRSKVAAHGCFASIANPSRLRAPGTRWPGPLQGCSEIRNRGDLRKICRHAGVCRKEAAAFADSEIGRQGLAGIRERRGAHRAQRKGRRNRNRVYRRGAGRRLDRVGGAENARRSRAKNRAAVFRFGESGARVNERRGSRAEFTRQSKQKRELAAMQDLRYRS